MSQDLRYFVEVFDPEFKFVKEVPSSLVVHLPPARLNITRLVFCRNYKCGDARSCSMGEGCKFVHADVDVDSLEAHPIHVKYSWRHEDLCTYARLPPGEVLSVLTPTSQFPDMIPSQFVLVTKGSERVGTEGAVMSHCLHYHFNRMCNRGERCNFVHALHVDPTVHGDFKRAPAIPSAITKASLEEMRNSKNSSGFSTPQSTCGGLSRKTSADEMTQTRPDDMMQVENIALEDVAPRVPSPSERKVLRYRFNPYSAVRVRVTLA